MTDTIYAPNLVKPHMGGSNSEIDQHLEIYTHEVDKQFNKESLFKGLTPKRSLQGSNNLRIDRMGVTKAKGRRSGEFLESQPIRTDKFVIMVDTVIYIRNPIDYQDDWTGPNYWADLSENNGIEFAIQYDKAHIIQLIKARDWNAPKHLKGAFFDGIEIQATIKKDAKTQEDLEANAIILNLAHLEGINTLVKRRCPTTNLVTLVTTDIYSTLIQHPKLMNILWGNTNDDGFKQRRVVTMNGISIVEFQEFPKEEDIGVKGLLGDAYTVTKDDVQCQMVTFDRRWSLLTVEVKPYTTVFWDDKRDFTHVLDCYTMYNVGVRRPDMIVSTKVIEI